MLPPLLCSFQVPEKHMYTDWKIRKCQKRKLHMIVCEISYYFLGFFNISSFPMKIVLWHRIEKR